jgi:sugar lactone lactonase YvrE
MPILAALLAFSAGAQAQFGTVAVGTTSGQQTITVTAKVAGTVASVKVLTAGTPSVDFAAGSGAQCGTPTLAQGGTCTQSVTFTPKAPGVRFGAVVLLDAGNNVLGAAYIHGIGSSGLGLLAPGNILTFAGNGTYTGPVLDGSQATAASLYLPTSIALDGAGNLYIADSGHNRIRKVTAATGVISTIAGNGNPTFSGDNGPATSATLNIPSGVAIDGAGNLYIADTGNFRVRMVAASTGIITTAAGTGTLGNSGDGAAATLAELNQPQGVTVDVSGNLFIADTANHRIRRVDAVTGIITTVAGSGNPNPVTGLGGYSGDGGPATAAQLNFPYAIVFDAAGNFYIPDSGNNVVREVNTSGIITTFAGTGQPGSSGDGGAATAATLFTPSGVAVDPAGNIYIATGGNRNTAGIRKVNSGSGDISTLVENNIGQDYNNGAFQFVSIYGPIGLLMDGSGNLYFADSLNMIVQQIQSNFVALNFTVPGTRQGDKSAPQVQTIENDGNAPYDLTAITVGTNLALDPATTTCAVSPPSLAVDEDCEIGVVFAPPLTPAIAPPATAEILTGNIDVGQTGDTVDTPLDIEVVGQATVINSTTTSLTSNPNPSGFGQNVIFTATVTTGAGTGALAGNVTFSIDGTNTILCANPVAVNAGGLATCSTAALTVGIHKVIASYGSDPNHLPSTSQTLDQTVIEGTITTLTSSKNPSALGQNVTFIATVSVPTGGGSVAPDGTVIFYDGASILGTQTLGPGGVASLSTAALTNGVHTITADYEGDASNNIQGSSAALAQDVLAPSGITISSAPNPSTYGIPVVFTISVPSTGNLAATGTVNILDGSTQIGTVSLAGSPAAATFTTSTLAVGSHQITAAYLGDTNYGAGTSAPITQVVTQVQTTTTLTAAPNPGFAGGPVALTATVAPVQGVATPTGLVVFTSGGVTLGSAALTATGTATINPVFNVGAFSIVATYTGTTNDAGSASAPLALTIQIATTQTVVVASPSPGIVDSPETFSAKVTGNGGIPAGTVTFSADGVAISTPVTLDATGTATLAYSTLSAGPHTISASYSGDTDDLPSVSPTINLVIGTIPTATALGATSVGTPPQVSLVAAVVGVSGPTPTGTVTFMNGATVIGAATLNSGGVATLNPNLATGSYSIVAVYGGDPLHSPSTSQPVTVLGTPSGFNLVVTPPTMTVATSQSANFTVNLTSIAGFADTIAFGCSALPAAVNCHFSSISLPLAADGTATAQLTIDTNNPLGGGSTAMNAHPGNRSYLAGLFLPFSIVFGLIFWRFRKRNKFLFSAFLILLLSGATMLVNGCSGSGFSQVSATPGTYVIQVTGTGTNSDIIHYQNVTLTVTQ